ncbi:MAG: TIGR01212 family radical SAM protein [Prevotellaceae bacterium]|jgi:radical SAM protein (TIGR01212 family)|nr:TIGR01212 family radical SAM protein [Prevotellaceae bacterium]
MLLSSGGYLNYNSILKLRFSQRVQKISINAGFTCPNRNGRLGFGGCTYCNNQTFIPAYCLPTKSVEQQLEDGIAFFHHKYNAQLYFAYFQSYTSTYSDFENLRNIYAAALSHPKVVGLVVGTRPDCVDDNLLNYFQELAKKYYVMIEYGIESTDNQTLKFINRGHDYHCARAAIEATAARGINVAAHLILGLPGENYPKILAHAAKVSQLPLTALKLHQLQIVRGTKMAQQFAEQPEIFSFYTLDEYIDLCIDFLELTNPNIAIERFISQSPKELLVVPHWGGIKNFEFNHKLIKRMQARATWQGKKFCKLPDGKI